MLKEDLFCDGCGEHIAKKTVYLFLDEVVISGEALKRSSNKVTDDKRTKGFDLLETDKEFCNEECLNIYLIRLIADALYTPKKKKTKKKGKKK